MPTLDTRTRDHLRKLSDDREAARQLCFAAWRKKMNTKWTSDEWEAVDAAADQALNAWSAASKRQEQAFIDAGI